MAVYPFAVNNVKDYLRSDENQKAVARGKGLDAFAAAQVLAIAFMKAQEEVLADLIKS